MATPELVLTIEVVSNVQRQIQQTATQLQELVQSLQAAGSRGVPGLNQVKAGLDETGKAAAAAGQSFGQLGTSIRGLQDPISGAITGFKSLVGAVAGLAVVKFAGDLANAAARVQTLGTVLEVVGTNAGFTKEQLQETDKAVQRLGVSSDTSKKALTTLIQSNLGLERATQLATAAQDISAVSGRSVTDTYQALANTLQFVNARSLRQLGITVNQAAAEQKYALEIGKTTDQFTLQDRRIALLNGTLEEATKLQGAYQRSLNDVGKRLIELPNQVSDLAEALGANLLPAFLVVVKEFSSFVQTLAASVQGFNANSTAAENFAKAIEPFVQAFFSIAKTIAENINLIIRFIELLAVIKAANYLTGLIDGIQKTTTALVTATGAATGLATALNIAKTALAGLVIGLALKPIAELTQLYLENQQAGKAAAASAETYKNALEKIRQLDLSAIGSKLKEGVDVSSLSERDQEQFTAFVNERKRLIKELQDAATQGGISGLSEDVILLGSRATVETNKLSAALDQLEKSRGVAKLAADLAKLPDTAENVKSLTASLRELSELKFTNQAAELQRVFTLTEQANRISFDFRGQLESQRQFVVDSIALARERADRLLVIANQEAVKLKAAAEKAAPKTDTGEIADQLRFAQEQRKIAEGLAQAKVQAEQGVLAEVRKNLDAATARFIKYKDDVIALTQQISNERISREQQIAALQDKLLGRTGTFFEAQRLEATINRNNFEALLAETKGDFEKSKSLRDEAFKAAIQLGNLGELKDASGKVLSTEAQTVARGLALAQEQNTELERVERQRLEQAEKKKAAEEATVQALQKQQTEQAKVVEGAITTATELKIGVSEQQINEFIAKAQAELDKHEFDLKVKANAGNVTATIQQIAADVQTQIDQEGIVAKINAEVQADLNQAGVIFAQIQAAAPTITVKVVPEVDPALADFAAAAAGGSAGEPGGGGIIDAILNLFKARPIVTASAVTGGIRGATGGRVPGSQYSESSDNVLAMLTPGEMITRVRAVKHYGENFFQRLNAMQIPKWALPSFAFGGTVPRFQDGGIVGTEGGGSHLSADSGLVSSEKAFSSQMHPVVLNLGGFGSVDLQGSDRSIEYLKRAISQAATKRRRS